MLVLPIRNAIMDDLPYRSAVPSSVIAADRPSTKDENDHSTLKAVQQLLAEAVNGLYKDFNAFNVLQGASNKESAADLVRQVEGRQIAYGYLRPVLDAVEAAIERVDRKYRQ